MTSPRANGTSRMRLVMFPRTGASSAQAQLGLVIQSSYNIYLYGGAGFGPNATSFDDVYILTIPSFTWIKWYPTSPGTGSPHNSLTCNVIDNAQMLVIGGTFPDSDACDATDCLGKS
jgi:hypothetical protein